MKRVAIFGNTGAGKSTLAKRLAEITGLPLYPIDLIYFPVGYRPDDPDGGKISHEEFLKVHAPLLKQDEWIIDGFCRLDSAWERFAAADTLVYIDLPLSTHYWWVTKRFLKGLFRNPEGWPDNSPIWCSTLNSYRVVWRCHRRLTPKYLQLVAEAATSKRVHHLTSRAAMNAFLQDVLDEQKR